MSMSKRLMFDPEFAAVRRQHAEEATAGFQFRIPTRRRNKVSISPRWDPLWESAIEGAALELNVEHVRINDGIYFKQQADCNQVRARAEELWQARHEHYAALRARNTT